MSFNKFQLNSFQIMPQGGGPFSMPVNVQQQAAFMAVANTLSAAANLSAQQPPQVKTITKNQGRLEVLWNGHQNIDIDQNGHL